MMKRKAQGLRAAAEDAARRAVRDAFSALPLDQRLIALVEVELDLLGDAAQSVFNTRVKSGGRVRERF